LTLLFAKTSLSHVEFFASRRIHEAQATRERRSRRVAGYFIAPEAVRLQTVPFVQKLTCTINEACEMTGLGRTKLYELIGDGHLATTTVGRRRLVVVRSLLSLLESNASV